MQVLGLQHPKHGGVAAVTGGSGAHVPREEVQRHPADQLMAPLRHVVSAKQHDLVAGLKEPVEVKQRLHLHLLRWCQESEYVLQAGHLHVVI